ncbi:MAG: PH domain-containing protein [Bacteroidales bacterium]|nr:PH domain-containing protein [Bacteroidales bacterium]
MIDFNNASVFKLKKTEVSKFDSEMRDILLEDETIVGCYQDIRDHVVFTNKRIIAVNVQGITGKKKDFTTLPYSKITAYSIETAGTFDLDSELDLFLSGMGKVRFEFRGSSDILEIGRIIAKYALR